MRWSCYACGAVYDERPGICSTCLQGGTLTPLPTSTATLPRRPRGGPKSALDLRRERVSPADWPEEVTRVLGRLPATRWDVLVHGPPGGGKSTLVTVLADRLAGGDRRVLYAAVEEGHSEAILQRLGRLEIINPALVISTAGSWPEVLSDLDEYGPFAVVVVDSFSALYPTPDLQAVAGNLDEREVASILVAHDTKDGAHAGPARLAHEVDVVVEVEALRFAVRKCRFGPLVEGTVDLADVRAVGTP